MKSNEYTTPYKGTCPICGKTLIYYKSNILLESFNRTSTEIITLACSGNDAVGEHKVQLIFPKDFTSIKTENDDKR